MGNLVFIAVAVGCIAGALCGVVFANAVTDALARHYAVSRRAVGVGAVAGGALALLPSFLLAIVIGGNFGGGWGEVAAGTLSIVVGLGLGIVVVFALGVGLGASMGALVVALIVITRRRSHAS